MQCNIFCEPFFYHRIDVDPAIIISSAMKTTNTTKDGTNNQGTPKWIEVKVSDAINAYFPVLIFK